MADYPMTAEKVAEYMHRVTLVSKVSEKSFLKEEINTRLRRLRSELKVEGKLAKEAMEALKKAEEEGDEDDGGDQGGDGRQEAGPSNAAMRRSSIEREHRDIVERFLNNR